MWKRNLSEICFVAFGKRTLQRTFRLYLSFYLTDATGSALGFSYLSEHVVTFFDIVRLI